MKDEKVLSPFSPGSVIAEPARLFGRDGELRNLRTYVVNSVNHVQVLGERKFGKSSLLRCFEATMRNEDRTVVVYADVSRFICSRWVDFYGNLLRATDSAIRRSDAEAHAALRQGLLRILRKPPFPLDTQFCEKLLKEDLSDNVVLDVVEGFFQAASAAGLTVILLLDELAIGIKHFRNDDSRFAHLRSLALERDRFDVRVVFADRRSQEDIAPERLYSPGLNFISQTIRLGQIAAHDAERLLRTTAVRGNPVVQLSQTEIRTALEISGCIPFLLQHVGEYIFLRKAEGSHCDPVDLAASVFGAVRGHLEQQWRIRSDSERVLLQRIAMGQPGSVGEHQDLLTLLDQGLIVRSNGGFRLYSPLFERLVRGRKTVSVDDSPHDALPNTDTDEGLVEVSKLIYEEIRRVRRVPSNLRGLERVREKMPTLVRLYEGNSGKLEACLRSVHSPSVLRDEIVEEISGVSRSKFQKTRAQINRKARAARRTG